MRLAGNTWRTVISNVRLGSDEYRVIRPVKPILHGLLYEGRLGAQMTVDKAAVMDLAMAWAIAARSSRTIVYLPLRASASCADYEAEVGEHRLLDLVLLHHSLAVPVSRWTSVRSRLGAGTPHTMEFPPAGLPAIDAAEYSRWRHREFKDHLRWDIAADTLFLIGSKKAFELEGRQVRQLAEECPAHIAEIPDTHCCAEIGMGRMHSRYKRRPSAELHVEYCYKHR